MGDTSLCIGTNADCGDIIYAGTIDSQEASKFRSLGFDVIAARQPGHHIIRPPKGNPAEQYGVARLTRQANRDLWGHVVGMKLYGFLQPGAEAPKAYNGVNWGAAETVHATMGTTHPHDRPFWLEVPKVPCVLTINNQPWLEFTWEALEALRDFGIQRLPIVPAKPGVQLQHTVKSY